MLTTRSTSLVSLAGLTLARECSPVIATLDILLRTKMKLVEAHELVINELSQFNLEIEKRLTEELSKSFDLGHSGVLQFEVSPDDYRISLLQTEVEIIDSILISDEVFEEIESFADKNNLNVFQVESEALIKWFSDRWNTIKGPKLYSPAYVFLHGGLEAPRYDMENNRWMSVDQLWPDLNENN